MIDHDFLSVRVKDVADSTPPTGTYVAALKTYSVRDVDGRKLVNGAFAIEQVVEAEVNPADVGDLGLASYTWWSKSHLKEWLVNVAQVVREDEDVDLKEGIERAIGTPLNVAVVRKVSPDGRKNANINKFLPNT